MRHIGNLEITKENQEQFKDITEVTGYVRVYGEAKIEALQTVGGYVSVGGKAKLEAPQLQTVGGDVYVYGEAKLEALQTVGGYVSVYGNAELEAPQLQTVGGDVSVNGEAKLEALQTVGGNVSVDSEAKIEAPQLQTVGSHVYVYGEAKLEALQTVGGDVYVYSKAKLEAPQLQTVGSHVDVYGEAKLEALQTVGGDVSVYGEAKLEAPQLQTVGGNVSVDGEAKLEAPLLQTEKQSQEILNKLKTDPKKLVQQHFERQGYLFADGILQTIVSKKTAGPLIIYKTKKIARDEINFVVYDGEYYSHGETLEQAKNDLIFKRTSQDTSKFQEWKLTDKKPLSELIEAYRSITGACSSGTKDFCSNRDLKEYYTIEEAIKITAGAYNSDKFASFFNERA